MAKEEAVILIPSLHPDHLLKAYVDDLIAHGFTHIVVVDDGSGPDYNHFFDELRLLPECTVLAYPKNRGKGYALKYGMQHILGAFPDAPGVITADSDGQHTAPDCLKVAEAMLQHPDRLVLGSRDFSSAHVPPKSKAGNRLTSFFFALLYGHWLPDTQTGLRGISSALMPKMTEIPGDRFEYEMNMLIHIAGWRQDFEIVPIDTIYLDANAGTHFRPFHDSARIYKLLFSNFFKFASASALSTVLDHVLFNLFERLLIPAALIALNITTFQSSTLVANVLARIGSSLFNYRVNRQFVFSIGKVKGALARYIALAVVVILASTWLIDLLNLRLGMDKGLAKILVDTILFFVNYRIMKSWVFAAPQERTPTP